jgi:hypothetical protein
METRKSIYQRICSILDNAKPAKRSPHSTNITITIGNYAGTDGHFVMYDPELGGEETLCSATNADGIKKHFNDLVDEWVRRGNISRAG